MSKELEALENIKREAGIPYFSSLYDLDMWDEDFENVETALKALELIKDKRIDVELLMKTENAKDYNKYSKNANKCHNLGQGQYELLKEVLL